MPQELREGVHRMSNEMYHKDLLCPVPSLSRSTIKDLFFKTPAHARWNHPRLNPDLKREERSIFDIGSAAHSLLLEGVDKTFVVNADSWRTKAAQESRDQALETGKIPLLIGQYTEITEMIGIAGKSLIDSELNISITDGESELSYFWQEDETWFRVRTDWISDNRKIILDYKTTGQSANPNDFKQIVNNGLDIQDSLYRRGVRAIEGTDPDFYFMVQETFPPYLCSFIGLPPQYKDLGKRKVEHGIKLWNQCLKSGIWPGYPHQVCYVDPRPWDLEKMEIIQYQGDDENGI